MNKRYDVWQQLTEMLLCDEDEKPTPEVISSASQFVLKAVAMDLEPEVGPDAMGGVAIYFDFPNPERWVWVSILNSGSSSILLVKDDGKKLLTLQYDPVNSLEIIRRFMIIGEFPTTV